MRIVYKGIANNENVRKIHKALFDATINKRVISKPMLASFDNAISRCKRKMQGVDTDIGLGLVAILLLKLSADAEKAINRQENKKVEETKLVAVDEAIETARKYGRIFYLASSHDDCALDHKPYQGRMYVDRYWYQVTGGDKRVIDYVKQHNLRTVQWVMGKPVWFITRPHCRHYFQALTPEEAMGNSLTKLKNKYNTHDKRGRESFKTPEKVTLEKYEQLLRECESLYAIKPNKKLLQLINKYKMLIKRWKSKING